MPAGDGQLEEIAHHPVLVTFTARRVNLHVNGPRGEVEDRSFGHLRRCKFA